ncbi:MAG TPA: cobalt ECF transporter T component CbiQ [Bacillota bacterium]|nr:cobalt ECF transporter T component CbiQ [Bacillota bacterium]
MFNIDCYAYSNKLRSCHPGEKFVFAFLTMAICLAFPSRTASLAVIVLMAGAAILGAGIPWRVYIKLMSVPLSFLLAGAAAIAVSVSRGGGPVYGITIGVFTLGVSPRDFSTAADVLFKSLGSVSCLYFLSLTTPVTEIISVLKKMRIPALFIELMSLVYRFIFVMMETASRIYVAQSSRWGYASFKTSYRSLSRLLSAVFLRSYYRSQMTYTALVSRCYTGELNVIEPRYAASVKNIMLIVLIEILLLALTLYGGGVPVGGIHS